MVQGLENGETYSPNQASTALHLVANNLGFKKNLGLSPRNQRIFGEGRKCVDYFVYTKSSSPFPIQSAETISAVETD